MNEERICTRPARWLVALPLVIAGCFLCMAPLAANDPKTRHDTIWILYLMVAVVSAFLGMGALWAHRSRIEADADGLRWRGPFRSWRQARWSHIAMFRSGVTAKGQRYARLTFRDGGKLEFDATWERFAALRDFVAARSPASASPTHDGPRVFRASAATLWLQRILFTGGGAYLLWCAIAWPVGMIQRARGDGSFGAWAWGAAATMAAVSLPLTVLCLWAAWQAWRSERPGLLTLDAAGFRYEVPDRAPLSASWSEVTACRRVWNGYLLETPQGVARVTTSMERYHEAAAFLRERVPALLTRDEDEPPVEERGDIRVYRYRNSLYRTVLVLPIALGVMPLLMPVLYRALGMDPPEHVRGVGTIVPFAGVALVGLWGLWRMQAARIEVDGAGIAQFGLSGITRLRWSDIDRYDEIGSDLFAFRQLTGARGRVRWWKGLIGEDQLRDQVARRVPQTIARDLGGATDR